MSQINEVQFTANVKSWIDAICRQLATADPNFPFLGAEIEERGGIRTKRRDLVLRPRRDPQGYALTGEVKLPDRPEGRSPYSESVVLDAHQKANALGVEYFFTWNVNRFVLWETFKPDTRITDRAIAFWDWAEVADSDELLQTDVQEALRRRWEEFLLVFAEIYRGAKPFPRRSLDQWFIHLLECALDRPSVCACSEIALSYRSDPAFHGQLDQWMIRNLGATISEEETDDNLRRAAKYSCYVITNRIVFYDALRRKYATRLRPLSIPKTIKTGTALYERLEAAFQEAERVTEDYETVFQGDAFGDSLPFLGDGVIEGWRGLIEQVDQYDFTALDYDIIGQIFDGLISPAERHRYGQHYTKSEIVDLINAFTIRSSRDRVLDPACGGGTFLIRAYARKKWLAVREQRSVSHESLLSDIYGVDLSAYAVHLSTISLATRDLVRLSNYPRIACSDFFDVTPGKATFPAGVSQESDRFTLVALPELDAVVGNPPYIRQERLSAEQKRAYGERCKAVWNGIHLSGRSDIHVYFWPHVTSFLKAGGYFGFLTSSSWLDVEYGFALQRWVLENFAIVAIMESSVEPWFSDARVATAVTILQREPDRDKRLKNPVRFVQIRRPLAQVLSDYEREGDRLEAAERIRDFLEGVTHNLENQNWRIRVVRQEELISALELSDNEDEGDDEETRNSKREMNNAGDPAHTHTGGKWGVYLRAPDVFFELLERFKEGLVPLGKIAKVRYGLKSGCDDFFFPRDVTDDRLREMGEKRFRETYGPTRKQAETVRVCKPGDGSIHLIEAEFLEPEVHSLMEIDAITIDPRMLERKVLVIRGPRSSLRAKQVGSYVRWGESQGYHRRVTCAARETEGRAWFNIEPETRSIAILPKIQQYRHIIALNDKGLIANCSLLEICGTECDPAVLVAVLNSTLVGLIKWNYGRGLGREANLQLDVYSAKMMLVPNPVPITRKLQSQIKRAFREFAKTQRRNLAEELSYPERQLLDDLTLQILGVKARTERKRILADLYSSVRNLHRELRSLELKAQANRLRSARKGRSTPQSIGAEIWDALVQQTGEEMRRFPSDFLPKVGTRRMESLDIPEGTVAVEEMFGDFSVSVGRKSFPLGDSTRAELLVNLIDEGVSGGVMLPESPGACQHILEDWRTYRDTLRERFEQLATQRSGDPGTIERIVSDLWRRYRRWSKGQP
jgi:methylase of polypeptide subunit release factors